MDLEKELDGMLINVKDKELVSLVVVIENDFGKFKE